MIEKVARATYNSYFDNQIGCTEPSFDDLPEDHKDRMLNAAKAAITAMREPNKEMLMAGATAKHSQACDGGFGIVGVLNAETCYPAMIDAALKDE